MPPTLHDQCRSSACFWRSMSQGWSTVPKLCTVLREFATSTIPHELATVYPFPFYVFVTSCQFFLIGQSCHQRKFPT